MKIKGKFREQEGEIYAKLKRGSAVGKGISQLEGKVGEC